MNPITTQKRPTTLMTTFNFNLSDLSANEAGKLSKRQTRIAEATQPNPIIQLILMGHVAIILGVLSLIVLAGGATTERLVFLAFAGMVILSPFLYAMNRINMAQNSGLSADDLASGEALSVSGHVELVQAPALNQPAKIAVEDMRFTVPKEAVDLFMDGTIYTVFYASHSKKILSITETK